MGPADAEPQRRVGARRHVARADARSLGRRCAARRRRHRPDARGRRSAVDVEQDGSRYFDLHHTANDVLTEVDPASLDAAMRAVMSVAYAAALDVEGITRE